MPGHKVGRRWQFRKDEVDGWVRSGTAGQSGMHKELRPDVSN